MRVMSLARLHCAKLTFATTFAFANMIKPRRLVKITMAQWERLFKLSIPTCSDVVLLMLSVHLRLMKIAKERLISAITVLSAILSSETIYS